ncbi:hypothetical protein HELRODRAFT_128025, partial [Helobdella robusta]|uniref:Chitin-binding type-2 domain-containing protein n=1 Tax=Helobdella robusta TaxID=6412 RepID=T1EHK5_HELRO
CNNPILESSAARDCSQPGIFPDPSSCSKYIQCANGNKYNFDCQPGLYFNTESSVCDWA